MVIRFGVIVVLSQHIGAIMRILNTIGIDRGRCRMTWMAEIKAAMPTIARYIMAGMFGYNLLQNILHHGENGPEKKYNGWVAFITLLVMIALLHMGGFWG